MLKFLAGYLVLTSLLILGFGTIELVFADGPHRPVITTEIDNEVKITEVDLHDRVEARILVEQKLGTNKQVKTCRQFLRDFAAVAKLTKQPVELLIGIATIESGGCKNVGEHEAKGFMQVHKPSPRHVERAAKLIGIEPLKLDYIGNTRHNVLLGAVILDDYTKRFGNVADGLEAYNQGPSKVEVGDHSDFPDYVIRVLAASQLARR